MIDETLQQNRSRDLALRLYDKWTRERQRRPSLLVSDDPNRLKEMEQENFKNQLVEPRQNQLKELRELDGSVSFADQVGLLVMMELPTLETSTLLHRLSRQLAEDPETLYFSQVNMDENCGSGCG